MRILASRLDLEGPVAGAVGAAIVGLEKQVSGMTGDAGRVVKDVKAVIVMVKGGLPVGVTSE